MPEENVIEMITVDTLPTVHKLAIFLLGNLAAFGASMLVEKGYVAGLTSWQMSHQDVSTK